MMGEPVHSWVDRFVALCQTLHKTAETAENGKKSLSGANYYGDLFHRQRLELAQLSKQFLRTVEAFDSEKLDSAVQSLTVLESEKKIGLARRQALKTVERLAHTVVVAGLQANAHPPAPVGQPVLAKEVVTSTKRQYLINIVIQANACYEVRCWDACAVMIRKLVESVIIELYESSGRASDIKNPSGDYYMLADLIQALLANQQWTLARETRNTVPKLKALGDRSAHNRRYLANKGDVDDIIPGLRVVIDDLLHLAGLK